MVYSDATLLDLNVKAGIMVLIYFLVFLLVTVRQGSSTWLNMSRHPSWAPTFSSALIFFIFIALIILSLPAMLINMLSGLAVKMSSSDSDRLDSSLAVVGITILILFFVAGLVSYNYFHTIEASTGYFGKSYRIMWIFSFLLFVYSFTGATSVFADLNTKVVRNP